MAQQVATDPDALAEDRNHGGTHEVAADVAYQRLAIVNVVFIGRPDAADRDWVLVDAGLAATAGLIAGAAESRFGDTSRPAAIILTHGHFDHVGALLTLADRWDVPIYAHPLEHPYLNGKSSYPPPDPSVGGGLMATLSRFYPRGPIDCGDRLKALPADGSVPDLFGWKWIATPGHSPGHVSLWRSSDRTLISGDAFITTAQESAYAVAMQRPELHGPPKYYTMDWEKAAASVRQLAGLKPDLVVSGHGPAMRGRAMREALHALANDFERIAVPEHGRYVGHPAKANMEGVTYVPPK